MNVEGDETAPERVQKPRREIVRSATRNDYTFTTTTKTSNRTRQKTDDLFSQFPIIYSVRVVTTLKICEIYAVPNPTSLVVSWCAPLRTVTTTGRSAVSSSYKCTKLFLETRRGNGQVQEIFRPSAACSIPKQWYSMVTLCRNLHFHMPYTQFSFYSWSHTRIASHQVGISIFRIKLSTPPLRLSLTLWLQRTEYRLLSDAIKKFWK